MIKFIVTNIFLLLLLPNVLKSQSGQKVNILLTNFVFMEYVCTSCDDSFHEPERIYAIRAQNENICFMFKIVQGGGGASMPNDYVGLESISDLKDFEPCVYAELGGRICRYECTMSVYVVDGDQICISDKEGLTLVADFDMLKSDESLPESEFYSNEETLILYDKGYNEYGVMVYLFCNYSSVSKTRCYKYTKEMGCIEYTDESGQTYKLKRFETIRTASS